MSLKILRIPFPHPLLFPFLLPFCTVLHFYSFYTSPRISFIPFLPISLYSIYFHFYFTFLLFLVICSFSYLLISPLSSTNLTSPTYLLTFFCPSKSTSLINTQVFPGNCFLLFHLELSMV